MHLSLNVAVRLSVCLSIYLPVCLSVCVFHACCKKPKVDGDVSRGLCYHQVTYNDFRLGECVNVVQLR